MNALALATTLDAGQRLIPFDYQFRFELEGRGRVLRKTIAISVEAPFAAVSIGYGVIPRTATLTFGPTPAEVGSSFESGPPPTLGAVPLSAVIASAERALGSLAGVGRDRPAGDSVLRAGIQLNPDVAELALQGRGLDERTLGRLFRLAGAATSEIQFLYALFEEGTGRAFQSEPILNVSGLGVSNGERPFRHFSPPIVFEPRASVSLEITEASDFSGELYVTLQGYKVLGSAPSIAPGRPPRTLVRHR